MVRELATPKPMVCGTITRWPHTSGRSQQLPRRGSGNNGTARVTVRHLGAVAVPILAIAISLGGCSATPPNPYASEYQELGSSVPLALKRANTVALCLADNGYPDAEVQEDGSLQYDLRQEQSEDYNATLNECVDAACPKCSEPPSTQAITELYGLDLEAKKCLEAEGLTISEPPTEQKFIDDYGTEATWSPWAEVGASLAKSGRLQTMLEKCPDPTNFMTF